MALTAIADGPEPASIEEAYTALDAVVDRLHRTQDHEKRLFDQRNRLWRFLIDHGEKQAVIARRSDVTAMAVADAVGKSRRRSVRPAK